jgi:hypothetical protein
MKKIYIKNNLIKDIIFNKYLSKKYLKYNYIFLFLGTFFQCIIYAFTGNNNVLNYLEPINFALLLGIPINYHRVSINNSNINTSINNIADDYVYINDIDIIPTNFKLYDDMNLYYMNKIYKDGAYILVHSDKCSYIIKQELDDYYLLEDEDVKKLTLVR